MTEQPTADALSTPRTDKRVAPARVLLGYDVVRADFARELERELTEALRSLRREENARKVLAETNQRLVAEIKSLGGGYTKVSQ
jgi:hypothetical protein